MSTNDLTISIGERAFRGRLPHMRHRFRLFSAWRHALGIREDDEVNPETGRIEPSCDPDVDEMTSTVLAAIGLCWADDPLDVPTYLQVRREHTERGGEELDALHEFGLCIEDAVDAMGLDGTDLHRAGRALIDAIYESLPKKQEMEDAEDPFSARAGTSTGST